MAAHIAIVTGDEGWQRAAPLLASAWRPEIVVTLPWRNVVWARADRRVLVFNDTGEVICHVGLYARDALLDGCAVRIGGVGGVVTVDGYRRRGVAGRAVQVAMREIQEAYQAELGLLFCESRYAPLYERLGWRRFGGEVFIMQPGGRACFDVIDAYVLDLTRAPRAGVLDLCGLPW